MRRGQGTAVAAVLGLVLLSCADDGTGTGTDGQPTPDVAAETTVEPASSDTLTPEATAGGRDSDGGEIEPFDFATDSLCERISGERVGEMAGEALMADDATPIPTGSAEGSADDSAYETSTSSLHNGCEWTLETTEGDTLVVVVGDASLWRDFGGNSYDFEARMAEAGLTEYSPPAGMVDIGAWVVGHPAVSDGVVVHNGGFGQFAFGVPPGPWLQVSLLGDEAFDEQWDDGVASESYEFGYFALADGFLRELGWVS